MKDPLDKNDTKSSNLSELIAQTALDHYNRLPGGRGKPQDKEWTVYSALVATQTDPTQPTTTIPSPHACWVVSCATGTKCTSLTGALDNLTPSLQPQNMDPMNPNKGRIIKDSHAEVLTRRGFMRVLWREILDFLTTYRHTEELKIGDENLLETSLSSSSHSMERNIRSLLSIQMSKLNGETTLHFELKPTIQLHLYISDSPCGDASIYALDSRVYDVSSHTNAVTSFSTHIREDEVRETPTLNFTGAKIIVPNPCHHDPSLLTLLPPFHNSHQGEHVIINPPMEESTSSSNNRGGISTHIAREIHTQVLSALRLKSCRSNIPTQFRTQSLSCSDKIVRWIVLGLQGSGPLTAFIPLPLRLTSIVVSQDPRSASCDVATVSNTTGTTERISQLDALKRAIYHRAYEALTMTNHGLSNGNNHQDILKCLPELFIVNQVFPCSKAISENSKLESLSSGNTTSTAVIDHGLKKKRKLNLDIESSTSFSKSFQSPCGFCLNWQDVTTDITKFPFERAVEVIVGAKGIMQGKNPKTCQDLERCTSRLSRWVFRKTILDVMDALIKSRLKLIGLITISEDYYTLSYQQLKQSLSLKEARDLRQQLLLNKDGPLGGWLTTGQDGDFVENASL